MMHLIVSSYKPIIFTTMKLYSIIPLILFLLLAVSCQDQEKIQNPYGEVNLWYNNANKAGNKNFDVFYLLPSCVKDRVNANGDTLHHADPFNKNDRALMHPSFVLAEKIFGSDANFYSPYYSQITLESWRTDSLVESRFPRAQADVKQAFDYYMKNINGGRPFVLAGFSQGGKCVVELMKTITTEQYQKMIAAYVVGYKITPTDTLNYKYIKPAKGETDTGVTICYNSVATTDAICPALAPTAVCINPINWETSTVQAQLNDTVTVKVNTQHNVLIVDGFNPDNYYIPSLNYLFKKGNYHLQELYFYSKELSDNVKLRFHRYDSKTPTK